MWQQTDLSHLSTSDQWDARAQELGHLISTDEPVVTALSNAASFLNVNLDRINWVGFYLFDGNKLVLGPFAGKPACTVIPMGKGVCGTAAEQRRTIIVDDVHQFPGHIACDGDSRSEVVIPLVSVDGKLFGVLDVDSPERARFDPETVAGLEQCAVVISQAVSQIMSRLKLTKPFL